MRRGLYGASLGARPIKTSRKRPTTISRHNPDRLEERSYVELEAHEISITPSPHYLTATVSLRSDALADEGLLLLPRGKPCPRQDATTWPTSRTTTSRTLFQPLPASGGYEAATPLPRLRHPSQGGWGSVAARLKPRLLGSPDFPLYVGCRYIGGEKSPLRRGGPTRGLTPRPYPHVVVT